MVRDAGPVDEDAHAVEHREHLMHEAFTMALYVAICLLAALSLVPESHDRGKVLGLVWGTTLGLAIVHYFSFRVAGRMITAEERAERAALVAIAQLSGAAIVAAVVTVALAFTPTHDEVVVATYVVAGLIGVMGYLVARPRSTRLRAAMFGVLVLVLAVAVAALKIRLSK